MLFVDSSKVAEVQKYFDFGVVCGVTMNQKILMKDGNTDIKKAILDISAVCKDSPVHVELTRTNESDKVLIAEAVEYSKLYEGVVVKIPMWKDGRGLRLVRELKKRGVKSNVTCCMSASQAVLAASAGADYISLFFNRIADYYAKFEGFDEQKAYRVACNTVLQSKEYVSRHMLDSLLIAGSIRKPLDVVSALCNGADFVTVPPAILEQMFFHPKTEETIKEFDDAWKEANKGER